MSGSTQTDDGASSDAQQASSAQELSQLRAEVNELRHNAPTQPQPSPAADDDDRRLG